MVVVAHIHTHGSQFLPIAAQVSSQHESNFVERAVVLVAVKVVGTGVIGDVQVRQPSLS